MNRKHPTAHVLNHIVRKITSVSAPERIILFGSYARSTPGKDSDVDLLVVMKTNLPPHDRWRALRRAIGDVDVPVDVFVLTPEEFEETKDVIGGIAYAPAKYGRVLYEKP